MSKKSNITKRFLNGKSNTRHIGFFQYRKLFLTICMILVFSITLSSCSPIGQNGIKSSIIEKYSSYKEDMLDSRQSIKTQDDFYDFLKGWMKNKSLIYEEQNKNILVYTSKWKEYFDKDNTLVTEGNTIKPRLLICGYDNNSFDNSISPIAAFLSIIKLMDDDIPLALVLFNNEDNSFKGLKGFKLPVNNKDIEIFHLNKGNKLMYSTKAGYTKLFTFTKVLEHSPVSLDQIYRIKINVPYQGNLDTRISKQPNPIKELSKLLSKLKSSIYYQLISFDGGPYVVDNPLDAQALIAVDSDNMDKLNQAVVDAQDSFSESYSDDFPNCTYTIEQVENGEYSTALSDETRGDILSLIYTLPNGTITTNSNDEASTIGNLTSLAMNDNDVTLTTVLSAISKGEVKDQLSTASTLAELSGFAFNESTLHKGWKGAKDDEEFFQHIREVYENSVHRSFEMIPSIPSSPAYLLNDYPNQVNITMTDEKEEEVIKFIITAVRL